MRCIAEIALNYDQGGALRAPRAGASARPQPCEARPARAGPGRSWPLIGPALLAGTGCCTVPSSSPVHCPAPGRRV